MNGLPKNLNNLHLGEEHVRADSIKAIDAPPMGEHVQACHDALNHMGMLLRADSAPGTPSNC